MVAVHFVFSDARLVTLSFPFAHEEMNRSGIVYFIFINITLFSPLFLLHFNKTFCDRFVEVLLR